MEAINNSKVKRMYLSPEIKKIILDSEISLALQSAPPNGPNEFSQQLNAPEYFNKTPFFSIF